MKRMWQPEEAKGLWREAKVSAGRWREVESEAKSVVRISWLVIIYEARVSRCAVITFGAGRGSVMERISSLDI